jgi:general secretion pathway protein C
MPQIGPWAREDLPQLFGTVLTSQPLITHDNVLIMLSRFFALLIWGAVALSAAYWGLRWFGKSMSVPPGTASATMDNSLKGDMSKLLSGPAKPADSVAVPTHLGARGGRLQLLGVVAPRSEGGHAGVALLVLDGKPARAYRLGQAVDGDLVVQTISQRQVQIGAQGGPAAVSLDLPLMPAAATGSLPPTQAVVTQPVDTPAYGAAAAPARLPSRGTTGVTPSPGMGGTALEGSDPADPNATAPAAPRGPGRLRHRFPSASESRPAGASPAAPV